MAADIAAEEQFGPYLVYERLGVGGMATVHRALERGVEGFERVVALKRLLPHIAEDASFIKAFVREAKLASLLAHVNIVQIYELGRVGAEYFISMEYIQGRDLRQLLRHARKVTGPPPINVTTGLALQLCEALEYAHTKLDDEGQPLGLVHRDISPSNLLVTGSGQLKVIDFGIAKAQSVQLRTQTGRVKGKLAYMAPEAISGSRDLDARSDVWACGVILHELLTARPLFASKNEYQTLLKVQRGEILPPSAFNPSCPTELDAIAFKALARDPNDRFASASEMRDALLRVRMRYALQTSPRDVALWLDRAFAPIAAPRTAAPRAAAPTSERMRTPVTITGAQPRLDAPHLARAETPRPVRDRDDDEAVEMVWGNGDGEAGAPTSPVLLDEVPDVSEKHLAAAAGDSADDIPAPAPSHGALPRRPTWSPGERAPPPEVEPSPPRASRESGLSIGHLFEDDHRDDIAEAAQTRLGERVASARARSLTQEPVVRFSKIQAIAVPTPEPVRELPSSPSRVPQTKLGVQPAEVRPRSRTVAPSVHPGVTTGVSIVVRERPSGRWPLVAGLLLLAGGGAATAVYVTTSMHAAPSVDAPGSSALTPAIVHFDVTPKDAEIRVDGVAHTGVPWQTELAAGTHEVEIRRSGYTSYLTALVLAPRDKHSLHIELRPLGTAGANGEATITVQTTPAGLAAELDGSAVTQRTPLKLTVAPGAHTIIIKRGGVEIWRQTVNAEAASEYEFNPSFVRTGQPAAPDARKAPTEPSLTDPAGPSVPSASGMVPASSVMSDATAAADATAPSPVPATTPTPLPVPTPPAPVMPVVPKGPVTIAPNAVAKRSGDAPNISRYTGESVPAVAAAKLCIDPQGNVTSVEFVGKIDTKIANDLSTTLRTWKYAPYVQAGITLSACFVVTMRMK